LSKKRLFGFVAIVVAVGLWVGVAVVGLRAFGSTATWSMPGTASFQLEAGSWTIFEKLPDSAQSTVSMSDVAKARTVTVEQLQVTGPNGPVKLSCDYCADQSTAVPVDLALHNAIATFTADTKGEYRIVTTSGTAQLALADPIRRITDAMPLLMGLSLLGGMSLALGITMLVRGRVVRAPTGAGNTRAPALPPAGWYPNPYQNGTTSQMWWDGRKWTSNWR